MKPTTWIPPVVFLATSVPALLIMQALEFGGDYRIWIAVGAGVLATAFAQSRLMAQGDKQ